ncbi:MAG: deoxyguanosinetriphosphate triphosphohydrolase [Gammaproteobacteria bacterium]|nr:deoxyguanosinetriphosphate triphosphohydrolase [Gammaproteobacteria bacterium]
MPPLSAYAASEEASLGRIHDEPETELRGAFQRDRDRIIHSAAFRRLEYKTQVFVNHEGDMFRTRLTHSIEVAQISRTVARALGLNEDLTEAIALAHDLGHTPFGHAGQDALNECMKSFGGFEHNLQSLRVVDVLEEKYAAFPGLNLTFETREGILKHCSRSNARELGTLGERFLNGGQPGLEAQLANVADEIAYSNHDVDDGLRSGLIGLAELEEVENFREPFAEVRERWPGLAERRAIHEVIRRMINRQVTELVEESRAAIAAIAPTSIDDVRRANRQLIGFGEDAERRHLELKRFLRTRLYRHYRVHRMSRKAARIVRELFETFIDDLRLLPDAAREHARELEGAQGDAGRARAIADYVAGMTDRFAIAEHERIFSASRLT